jgi:hypothetical protein
MAFIQAAGLFRSRSAGCHTRQSSGRTTTPRCTPHSLLLPGLRLGDPWCPTGQPGASSTWPRPALCGAGHFNIPRPAAVASAAAGATAHRPGRGGPELQLRAAAGRGQPPVHCAAVLGVQRGDRVAIVLPQRFETAVAYMAVLQMGAVGMPLSTAVRPGGAGLPAARQRGRVAVVEARGAARRAGARRTAPSLETADLRR